MLEKKTLYPILFHWWYMNTCHMNNRTVQCQDRSVDPNAHNFDTYGHPWWVNSDCSANFVRNALYIYIFNVFITQTYLNQKHIFFIVRQGTYFTTRKLSIGLRKSASVLNDNLRRNMANHGNPRLTCCVYACVYDCICVYWIYIRFCLVIFQTTAHLGVLKISGELTLTPYSAQFTSEILSEITENGWTWTESLTTHHPDEASGPVHKRLAMANMLVTYPMYWCWPHGCAFQSLY